MLYRVAQNKAYRLTDGQISSDYYSAGIASNADAL